MRVRTLVAWKDALEKAFLRQSLGSPDVAVTIVSHPPVLSKANLAIVVTAPHTSEQSSSLFDVVRPPRLPACARRSSGCVSIQHGPGSGCSLLRVA
jgi:hypothetical protein